MNTKRMNVLMYCLSSVSGGAEAYLRNVAPLLAKRFTASTEEHSLKFLAHEDQAPLLAGIADSQICWVRGLRPMGVRRVLWEYQHMPHILHEQGTDVLFNPYQIRVRAQGVRQVIMVRNMEPFLFRQYTYSARSWLRNFILQRSSIATVRRADRVIAISKYVENHLQHGIGIDRERIRTIYHGRSTQILSDGNGDHDRGILSRLGIGDNFIFTCGGLFPYRRCEDVIKAFNQCTPGIDAGMQLVIAGNGTDRRYRELLRRVIAESPFRERILMLGHVKWETMGVLYRQCAICVIATEIEACPNIAIEAMAAGCAIISSDRPPLPEMFNGASLEYQARDINHLSEQIHKLLCNEDLYNNMKQKALDRAITFSWEKCVDETYDALTNPVIPSSPHT